MTHDMQPEIEKLEQSLAAARTRGDQRAEAENLYGLGNAYRQAGDFQQTSLCYSQSAALANANGDAKTLFNLGLGYGVMGDDQQAIQCLEQSLAIYQALGSDMRAIYRTLSLLASRYDVIDDGKGNAQQSIRYHQQALTVAEQMGSYNYQINCLVDIARANFRSGDIQQAVHFYEQARTVASRNDDRDREAHVLTDLGRTYASLTNPSQAISCFEQALALIRASGNQIEETSILNQVGRGHLQLGDIAQAISFHQQALTLARSINDGFGESESLFELGRTAKAQGNLQSAISHFERAFTLVIEGNKQDWGRRTPLLFGCRLALVESYEATGNYTAALHLLEQDLADSRPSSPLRIQELEARIAQLRQKITEQGN